MVKFGKYLREKRNPDYPEKYINYKALKQLIKSIKQKMNGSIEPERENVLNMNKLGNALQTPVGSSGAGMDTFKDEMEVLYEQLVESFIELLDKEIKKFYIFFADIEKKLYVKINLHLHIRDSYDLLKPKEINTELEELIGVSLITIDLLEYVVLNIVAIQKILKKFDKKFQKYFGKITGWYLTNRLTNNVNSDLNYILQLKIVDEVSTLLDDLNTDLLKQLQKRVSLYSNIDKSQSVGGTDTSENSRKESLLKMDKYKETLASIHEYSQLLKNNNIKIDDVHHQIQTKIYAWRLYFPSNAKMLGIKFNNPDLESKGFVSAKKEKDIFKEDFRNSLYPDISTINIVNMRIIMIHTFLYSFNTSVVIPTNFLFLETLQENPELTGLILAIVPFGNFLMSIFYAKTNFNKFKLPLVVSSVLLILGNLFYSISENTNSIIPMVISRLLVGMACTRTVSRQYIINYVPRNFTSRYFYRYLVCSTLGFAMGPLIAIFLGFGERFNLFTIFEFVSGTYPTWISFFLNIFLMILILHSFVEPVSDHVQPYSEFDNLNSSYVTEDEKDMIESIDSKLNELNMQSSFSDTNLVFKNLEKIKRHQVMGCSPMFNIFLILSMFIFLSKFIMDSTIISTPYLFKYYFGEFNDDRDVIIHSSTLLAVSLLFAIPMNTLVKSIIGKIKERKLLAIFLFVQLVCLVLISFLVDYSIIQYGIFFVFLILSSVSVEYLSSALLTKIVPPDYTVCGINAGLFLTSLINLGRVLGCCAFTVIAATSNQLNMVMNIISASLLAFIAILFFIAYREIREKAISRILKVSHSFAKKKNFDF